MSRLGVSCFVYARAFFQRILINFEFISSMSVSIARRETNWKFFSTKSYETEYLNQWVDNGKDMVNQSCFEQYNHEIGSKEGSIENSVEYAAAYGK